MMFAHIIWQILVTVIVQIFILIVWFYVFYKYLLSKVLVLKKYYWDI